VIQGQLHLPVNARPLEVDVEAFKHGMPESFNGLVPRKYQWEGAAFMHATLFGALCADDVGLGKVVEACLVIRKEPARRMPFIVVGPLAAMDAWVGADADPARYFGLNVLPLRSTTPEKYLEGSERTLDHGELWQRDLRRQLRRVDGLFINYQILSAWQPWLQLALTLRTVIVDESHEVRNVRALQSKMVRKLCRQAQKRFFLSATPVVNKLMDLYHQLDCVEPNLWGFYIPFNESIPTSFGTRYCSAFHDGYGWNVNGESNVEEFRSRLKNVLVRRTRAQVREELPPLDRQCVRVPIDALDQVAWKEHAQETDLALRMKKGHELQGAELVRLTKMASALSWAKRDVAVKRALEMARAAETRKLLVMCWYQRTAKYLASALKKAGLIPFGPILGGTNANKRLDEAHKFKAIELPEGQAAVLVATIGTAGQSLNPLSAASSLLITDLYWVPSVLIQAEGRVHREGQKAKSVLVCYLIVTDTMTTIDQVMWETLQRKAKSIENATGDDAALTLTETLGGHNEEESAKGIFDQLAALSDAALELT